MLSKVERPNSRCTDCYKFFGFESINRKCPTCKKGYIKSELRNNTWFECQACDATGQSHASGQPDGTPCDSCKGRGWLFTAEFVGGY